MTTSREPITLDINLMQKRRANGPVSSNIHKTELITRPLTTMVISFGLELVNATLSYGKALDNNASANISDKFDCLMNAC